VNKKVVVVGGTGRVGGSTARWLLEFGQKEGLDVNVILCGRNAGNFNRAKERIVSKVGKDREDKISFYNADFEKASELRGIINLDTGVTEMFRHRACVFC
jgi:hypothetical protein